MNGSSASGYCSDVTTNGVSSTCLDPASSVLFDGNIPALTGLQGNMWASQLLTIRSGLAVLEFDFTGTPNFVGVRRVEMVLFNCEQWEISVRSIILEANRDFAGTIYPTVSSCSTLVRVCMTDFLTNGDGAQTRLTLGFITADSNSWVHIAEVSFYGPASPTCPPDTIIIATGNV